MALFNTIDFLPPVFRSKTNQRFLGATMDQLVTDPITTPINGYIGRKFSPTYKAGDNYVPELSTQRQQYQLEPSVVVKDNNQNIKFNTGYVDLLNGIANNNGLINNHQRLFGTESYSYDGHFEYDKFVNYYNYYWLPTGPAPVSVVTNEVPYNKNFKVTRNTTTGGYVFTGQGAQPNTQLTLARGGTYTFDVSQTGFNFWIQSSPGVSGTDPNIATVNTRDVYGVKNNGDDVGTITFNVPLATAQDFFTNMPTAATLDAAVNFNYTDIQNQLLSDFLVAFPDGLDGIANPVSLHNATFAFVNIQEDAVYWTTPDTNLDRIGLDTGVLAPGTVIEDTVRTSSWRVNLVPTTNGTADYLIQLSPVVSVLPREKVFVRSGKTYASNQFWVTDNLSYQSVPVITATKDYLYYQDSLSTDFYGQIKLVNNSSSIIDVNTDIIGQSGYTSPNGIIFTNGLKIKFDDYVTTGYANKEFYVEGVGTSISLVPVEQLVIPETFGSLLDTDADYITINRASADRNPWTRSNRWFHKDVITATAAYNNTDADYGPNIPGRRPIIEFDANLQLSNYGRQAKDNITYIVTESTDAFNDIEGKITASVQGHDVKTGDRIVFSNDYDTTIIDKIFEVVVQTINSTRYITLVTTPDDPVLAEQNLLVTDGEYAGTTWKFDGTAWLQCQVKDALNQSPLFDLLDIDGYSFADPTVYPASSFTGSKLFGYSVGTGTADSILGFPLTYKNFNNIGDIVFSNYYDTDTFTYTSNQTTNTVNCNIGYISKYSGLTPVAQLNNWVQTKENSAQFQIFTKFYDDTVIDIDGVQRAFVQIDVLPAEETEIAHLKVYLNNKLLAKLTDYEIIKYGIYDVIILLALPKLGDKIDVAIFSNDVSQTAYYEAPTNLNYNPLNENFTEITLGQLRTHYNKLIENTAVNVSNNIPIQDHYIRTHGGTLLQHDAPLIYAMTFLNDPTVNFVNGLNLARKEYTKFKNKFLSLCSTLGGLDYTNPPACVDAILKNINAVKNISFPWYYSDMVPQGSEFATVTYSVLNVRQTQYEINSFFDAYKLSNRSVLVYVNGVQQVLGVDYTFSTLSPAIIFSRTLIFGDSIVIRDYASTDGNYIPETPSKLGLYPKSAPQMYVDNTYQTPTTVIRGHDGSIIPAFGDFRDDLLLELELRIYNNIKATYSRDVLDMFDVIPGRTRDIILHTDYSLSEYNTILSQNFLNWVGNNSVDYISNSGYNPNNAWTWNYSSYNDSLDGSKLQGSWRAIYKYWYDTDTPNLTPWEMLGLFDKPTWWDERYGPGPYTSGNSLLWEDLSIGYIWNGSNDASYQDIRFSRGSLTKFIPVDTAGNLIDPTKVPLVSIPSANQFNSAYSGADFAVGQMGPAETAWRRSSDYPYAIQLSMALTKPAKYFATQLDTSQFSINSATGQLSTATNQKISPTIININGDTTSGTVERTSGYINWIADGIKNLGIDPIAKINDYLSNLSVQLNYKVSGFTDTQILTVTAEQTTPASTNSAVIIPDSNYDVYLNKSVPVLSAVYSAVIVEKTHTGFVVSGYDPSNPFFTIIPSVSNNKTKTVTVNSISVKIYEDSTQVTQPVPYGTEFATVQQVADFLISYERHLVSQGFVFIEFDKDLEETRDWTLSVRELLYWAQQGWGAGTIIVLNPTATRIGLQSAGSVVDEITNISNGSKILDQNFLPIKSNDFNILRTENATSVNRFYINTLNGAMIAYAKLNLVQYEHTLVFDNVSDFGDIIYVPSQGTRQYRLKLAGHKTGAWTGALSAPGFIYSSPEINEWNSGTDYRLGDIIKYNNFYYTATQDIPASTTFNSIVWTQIQKDDIKTGLLPNFGMNAHQLTRIYDVDNPPINETLQSYSASLIGFRQRQFLTDLGISIPTQTKFYQGYIKEKGSLNSITALTKANFNNINGNINVYEEWAFRVGLYGGISNNTYSEFVLDQSVFTTNPVAFTIGDTYSAGNIIVNMTLANIYTASNTSSTVTSIYTDRVDPIYIRDLPSAGYMNLQDVDYTLFDTTNVPTELVSSVTTGSKIWVAKNADGNWEILRASDTNLTATTLTYTLDSSAQLTFDGTHNFEVGDLFVLKDFNTKFDQIYTVNKVTDASNVIITVSDVSTTNADNTVISPLQTLIRRLTITGTGTVYALTSSRVDTYADFEALSAPLNGWVENDRVWVDQDTSGWAVYDYVDSTWTKIREQQARVDINSISRTFIYNKSNNNILAALDFIDPAKGKVLNAVAQDIDYQLTVDPALYNQGTVTLHSDLHWGPQQVGKIWWDLNTVRYVDYEQDALIYRLNHWGEMFPGSSIDVYQWIESSVLPSAYTGNGTPMHPDDSAYSTYGYVDNAGNAKVKYYFWVKNLDTVADNIGKNNSVISITNAIENPQIQGIPYAEMLRNDTIALYNINSALLGKNSVVHLGSANGDANLIHSEYALVQEGNPFSQIPATILSKFADSLAGVDIVDNPVPDPALPPSQAYGISIRPRQTMIINRELALENYLNLVNDYLLVYPVVERKVLTVLNSSESIPTADSGDYDTTVDTVDELDYINTTALSAGYKVLVNSDSTYSGKWTIYELNSSKEFIFLHAQSYKTNLYWSYTDWYNYDIYDPTNAPDIVVANRLELGKLEVVPGQHIKVEDNGTGQFVVYLVDTDYSLVLVGIQNGTIQISTGATPGKELRQILLAMQENIFIDDLATEYNNIFFTLVKFILSEQKNIDWAFKTSFISATQKIRKLEEFPSYVPDNQSFYLDYINEVKPYRTVIREFVVDYVGDDLYDSDITDFDLPPYYDANLKIYRSPNGAQSYDDTIRSQGVYSQWYENYKYKVTSVIVETTGTGYIAPPQIIISGGGGTGATAYSVLNGTGGVNSIILTNPGSGYTSTPTITINGSGTGASASVLLRNVYDGNDLGHNVIRSVASTIKLDRVTYTNPNTFVFWSEITSANVGQVIAANTIINLNNKLYKLGNTYTIDSSVTFPISDVTVVLADSFNNANDRIIAYNGNINLKNLAGGIDYPGVIVDGNTYTGTYIDSTIQSAYTDSLGVNPSDINIDGGAYVSKYSSHAPEELVPGRMFDSLNITVFDTDNLGFRIFADMNYNPSYYRIADANTTTLANTLSITDGNIEVTDASKLPEPNPTAAIPGVVFINGEKITYYVRDTVNNRLGQIRRAVDGTSPSLEHAIGSRVVDSSSQQSIPYEITSSYTLTANTGFRVTETSLVSLGLILTSNVSANIGDILTQIDANTSVVTGTFRVLETLSNVTALSVALISGDVTGLGDVFDSALGFDETGFDNTISPVYINGIPTGAYVRQPYLIGNPRNLPNLITISGDVYVLPNNVMNNGNIWYNPGLGTPTDGTGLINSTTAAASFLKASLSFNVPPGEKP